MRTQQNRFNAFPEFGSACRAVLANLSTTPAAGKNLGGIQKTVGIEDPLHTHHRFEVRLRKDQVHEIFLLVSNAVLAAQRSADIDAKLHDLFAHPEDFLDLIRKPAVEKNQRMKISIAGMKHIRDAETVALGHAIDGNKNFRKP